MDRVTDIRETTVGFEPLLGSRQAATLIGVHHKTLEKWARYGQVPGYHIGKRWYFRASELDEWLQSRLNLGHSQSVRVN